MGLEEYASIRSSWHEGEDGMTGGEEQVVVRFAWNDRAYNPALRKRPDRIDLSQLTDLEIEALREHFAREAQVMVDLAKMDLDEVAKIVRQAAEAEREGS